MKLTEKITPLWREHYSWLLVFSCLPLFAAKNAFNLPFTIMMLMGAWLLYRRPRQVLADPLVRFMALLFLCFWLPIVLSLPDAVYFRRAFGTAWTDLRFLFAGIYIIHVLRDAQNRRRLYLASALLVGLWCLDAMVQFFAGYNLLGYPYDGRHLNGIFWPKLRLGYVTAVMSPLVYELIRRHAAGRPWLWLLLPCVFAAVLLSASRTSWLMLGVSGLLYLAYLYRLGGGVRVWGRMVAMGAGIFIAVFLLTLQYKPMVERAEVTMGLASGEYDLIDQATAYRLSLWKTAINMFEGNWLNGVGPRGFRYVYVEYAEPGDFWLQVLAQKPDADTAHPQTHPHQQFLEIAAETGLPGVLGYLLMAGLFLRRLWSIPPPRLYHSAPWGMAAIVAWFPLNVHLSLYASYWSSVAWWLLLVCVAMMAETRGETADHSGRRPAPAG